MNTKKMTAFIVGAMLIATVLVMAVSAAGMDRIKYEDMPRMVYEFDAATDTGIYINDGPTVRIYGEEDAIYPTQSYTEALDFIYPDPVDPFDPGVIAKDSATFNPAYMYNVVTVNDGASFLHDEKAFFRIFYEPGYDHAIDEIMDNTDPYDTDLRPVSMPDGALVTETTYMLVSTTGGSPITGAAGPGSTYRGVTRFMLPVRSPTPAAATQPGMEEDARVGLYLAEDGSTVTDGTIEVGLRVRLDLNGNKARFMDHDVTFVGCSASDAKFMISYIGNKDDRMPEPLPDPTLVPKNDGSVWGDPVYVTRYNEPSLTTDAEHRWFIRVIGAACDQYCDVVIGRRLVAGETFYADGVRYDMPAIYVTEDDKFKYITLQSPLPKCYDANCVEYWNDYSHVSCQWLTMLPPNTNVWVLPPFDVAHTMIDDIGLPKTSCTGGVEVDEDGDIYSTVDALEFHYIKEDTEDRFNSSLAERHARKDGVELWNWWSVFTKPYHYVELVLPNDEDETGTRDGYEYLITTSFIAPNSEAEERDILCKSSDEVHDIIDRAATIANAVDFASRDAYSGMPRMVFEYNAVDTEDLFVNDDGMNNATVRVYGEAGALYPTQSMTGAVDFIYPDAVDPFDPGVIAKDSVTFNPAYLDDRYDDESLRVDGQNADEKVFFRIFYEPGYKHPADDKMDGPSSGSYPVVMENGALVTETTYMLLLDNEGTVPPTPEQSGLPYAGAAKDGAENIITYFMLPTYSSNFDDDDPGMDRGEVVDLNYADGMDTSQLTDGEIEVQRRMVTLAQGETMTFMDHKIEFIGPSAYPQGHVQLAISYLGNMKDVDTQRTVRNVGQSSKHYVDRLNGIHDLTDPDWRSYFEIGMLFGDSANGYTIEITVGRYLAAGETFYVDGVRYDMPAIYVTDDDKFKYITFQSPLPKCEGEVWYGDGPASDPRNQADMSHVTCQWLANILESEYYRVSEVGYYEDIHNVWVLPPFNEGHTMIDDIGIQKESWMCAGTDIGIDNEAGNILGTVDPLKFCYIAEEDELRFDSSLAERHAYNGSDEIWNWWSIFTKPYQYTEIVLPDQETTGMADGNEYLVTTSFIAPNCEDEERDELCKSDREVHDIIDRASTLDDWSGPTITCGDVTDDGNVNMGDVIMLFDHVTYGSPSVDASVADVTGDGNVNMGDVIMLFDHVTYGAPSLNCQ